MTNIKALEDLRVYANDWRNGLGGHPSDVETLADRIESEISERFMELPVDADGVPIRIGDAVQFVNDAGGTGAKVEVCAVSNHYAYYGEGKHFYRAKNCRHYKPRTIEDALRDIVTLCANTWKDEKSAFRFYGVDEVMNSANVANYANEIRELLRGDAE